MSGSSVLSSKAAAGPAAKALPDAASRQLEKAVGTSAKQEEERFLALAEKGPADVASAPGAVAVPLKLYEAMKEAMALSYNDGQEHGGVIGRAADGSLAILKAIGKESQIDFGSVARPNDGLHAAEAANVYDQRVARQSRRRLRGPCRRESKQKDRSARRVRTGVDGACAGRRVRFL